jgi:hypothetical protein
MCLWSVFFALVLSVESGKLGCLEWWWLGGIYSPNQHSSRWMYSLSMGTLDSPVCTGHSTVHCPVRATSADRWGLEQLAIEFAYPCGAPDSSVAHRTVRCDLTSQNASNLLTF